MILFELIMKSHAYSMSFKSVDRASIFRNLQKIQIGFSGHHVASLKPSVSQRHLSQRRKRLVVKLNFRGGDDLAYTARVTSLGFLIPSQNDLATVS